MTRDEILEGLRLIDQRYFFGMFIGRDQEEESLMREAVVEAIKNLEEIGYADDK